MVSRGCSHIPLHHNCSVCGIYISQEEGMQAVRSDTISCLEITNLRRYQKNLQKQINRFEPRRVGLPQPSVLTLVESLISRFKMSRQTYALTIFLFTCIAGRKKMTSMRQQLFAGACLMLACKFADKQSNVPTISLMNRVLGVEDSHKDQLKTIEKEVFQALGYDLQLSTFVDLLELYIFNGVVFSNETHPDVGVIQTYILQEADVYLKSGRFMRYKQSDLAGWIIYKARKLFSLKEVWNPHLQLITGLKIDSIQQIVREFEMEEDGVFVRQSVVNIRYGHIQSTEKRSQAQCTLRKLLLKEQPVVKIEASKYHLHSIKSYEKLNISSFRVE